jgi:hypothetical protein
MYAKTTAISASQLLPSQRLALASVKEQEERERERERF